MMFTLPADVDQRPVVIDGAGTLGRQIATVYAAGGSDVRIFDLSAEQREAARAYVEEHLAETQQTLGLHPARGGRVEVSSDLQEAVDGIYLVLSALALVDSSEHRSPLVVGKLCRHYAPLALVPPSTVRLPDRTATHLRRRLPRAPDGASVRHDADVAETYRDTPWGLVK